MFFESTAFASEVAHHAAQAEHATEHAAGGAPHTLTILSFLQDLFPHSSFVHFLNEQQNIVFAIFSSLLISLIAWLGVRNRQMLPSRLQNFVEMIVEALDNFVCGIVGKRGREFTPFIGTLFLYIFTMNFIGVFPLMHSPTSAFTTTLPLAIAVFGYVQFKGIVHLGILGYFDHLAGQPRDIIGWMLSPLMLVLHIVGELARPLSLALRLFGNISGEHVLVAIFLGMAVAITSFTKIPIPIQFPFLFLGLLTAFIQAFVFSLLSTIYIALLLAHHFEHEEAHEHHEPVAGHKTATH